VIAAHHRSRMELCRMIDSECFMGGGVGDTYLVIASWVGGGVGDAAHHGSQVEL